MIVDVNDEIRLDRGSIPLISIIEYFIYFMKPVNVDITGFLFFIKRLKTYKNSKSVEKLLKN